MMKFRLLLLVLSLSCMVQPLLASHIIGGEMTYECLGGGDYAFELLFYRDCTSDDNADFDDEISIGIYSCGGDTNCTGLRQRDALHSILVPILELAEIPNNAVKCIEEGNLPCVERGVFKWKLSDFGISLPDISENYYVVYQRCCRNAGIQNIRSPEETGFTYFVEITPPAQVMCNNSPTFDNFPDIVVCQNFDINYDHIATDVDGDSLVYRFTSPIAGGGIIDQERPGPDGNPVPESPIFLCTGNVPTPSCPPPFEEIGLIEPTYSLLTPMGTSFINGENTTITINERTGLIKGVPSINGLFVVAIAVDEYRQGQYLGTIRREFQYTVVPCARFIDARIKNDSFICDGVKVIQFEHESFPSEYVEEILWEFDLGTDIVQSEQASPTITFPEFGNYEVKLLVNPDNEECIDSAVLDFLIFPETTADFSYELDSCSTQPVTFENRSSTESGDRLAFNWDFGDGASSSNEMPIHQYTTPGNREVTLTVTDINNCQVQAKQEVSYFPLEQNTIPPLIRMETCAPLTVTYDQLSGLVSDGYSINWDFGDGTTSNDTLPTHTYEQAGVYSVAVEIISPNDCMASLAAENITIVQASPVADFGYTPDEILISNPTATFIDNSDNATEWIWDFDGDGFSTEKNPVFTFPDTGMQIVELIVLGSNGCSDTTQQVLDITPSVALFMPNAFTPNDDGKNDIFLPVGFLLGPLNYRFSIWNRWGEQIFFTTNISDGWNGKKHNTGSPAPNGIYTYLIEFNDARGNPHLLKGYATLIR